MSRTPRRINPSQSVRHLFAWTLRETRTQEGFSLQGFAKRLGKSDSYLSAVELAQSRCTRQFAEGCDQLLGNSGRLVKLWIEADQEWERLSSRRSHSDRVPAPPRQSGQIEALAARPTPRRTLV